MELDLQEVFARVEKIWGRPLMPIERMLIEYATVTNIAMSQLLEEKTKEALQNDSNVN